MSERYFVPMAAFLCLLAAGGPSGRAQPGPAAETAFPTFPITFHVAAEEGVPVVDEAWIEERLGWANRLFEPHGVTFDGAGVGPLGPEHARLEDRRGRHRLGGLARAGVINCFVVASLRDVDDPERFIRGVHWRSRSHAGAHYVILSRIAGPTVLAHELGHFFGNRRHSDVPGNIMSYERGDGPPVFDDAQVAVVRRWARRFRDSGEIGAAR